MGEDDGGVEERWVGGRVLEVGRRGASGRRGRVRSVDGSVVELDEPGEDDALVVGVDGGVVVLAGGVVEAVVDEVLGVNEARVAEPIPLAQSPVEVGLFLGSGDAVGEGGGDVEEEFVGDGAVVGGGFRPEEAAAGGVVAFGLVLEDVDGGAEVGGVVRLVVGFEPGPGPPAFVVPEIVDEARGGVRRKGLFMVEFLGASEGDAVGNGGLGLIPGGERGEVRERG